MIAKEYLEQGTLNNSLLHLLKPVADRFDVVFEIDFDLSLSTHDFFDVKLRIIDQKGWYDFSTPLDSGEVRVLEQVAQTLSRSLRYKEGGLCVMLWIQSSPTEGFPFIRSYEVRSRRMESEIVFRRRKGWTLFELFQIQFWANVAHAGMHSKSSTGMSVGGRRFGWIMEMGFSQSEAEILCRLNTGKGGLRTSNGMYIGGPDVESLDDDEDGDGN